MTRALSLFAGTVLVVSGVVVAVPAAATTASSVATLSVVAAASKRITGATPQITGTARVGQTLTAKAGAWDPTPIALTYQWMRNGRAIPRATAATYSLAAGDATAKISVRVTGSRSGYTTLARTSAAVTVAAGILTPKTPTISGRAALGQTLTAKPGTWGPAPVVLSYQWFRGATAIAKATKSTYVLTPNDAAATISVRVTGVRAGYTTASRDSAGLRIAAGVLQGPQPTISGTPRVGQKLTASAGSWGPAPVALDYQWLRAGTPISGATKSTYTLAAADAGKTVAVRVTGTRPGFTMLAQTSTGVAVTSPAVSGPVPTIEGTSTVGEVLTVSPGVWTPAPVALKYLWLRDGAAISGATAQTYRLTAADSGKRISVRVTGARSGYTTAAKTSDPVTVAPGVAVVALSGTLTADTELASADVAVYVVDETLTVPAGVTLTVPAGAVIKFTGDSYAETRISVEGSLVANGTVSAPVVFTSLRDDSVGGDTNGDGEDSAPSGTDWSGISVSSETAVVSLTRSEVRFAQYGVSAGGATTAQIVDSVITGGISASRSSGSKYADRVIAITGNTVRDGAISVRSENTTSTAVPITVTGNTVTDHQPSWFENGMTEDFPIAVYDLRLQPSKLTGNITTGNAMNVFSLGGVLIENWTVPTTGPRLVIPTSNGNVGLTVPAGKTMTVPAGAVIRFTGDYYSQTGISVEGSLVANGTASAPVVFTSLRDDSVGGDTNGDGEDSVANETDWSGISVASETAVVSLTRSEVRFAQYGVSAGGAAKTQIVDSAITGGISASRAAGSKYADRVIAITGNTVSGGAISVRSENTTSTAVPITVSGNTVTDHQPSWFENGMTEDFPIAVYDRRLQPSKLTGNTATGNTMNVLALSGTLIENWTVPTTGPRLVIPTSNAHVGLTIPAGKTLTVPAGAVIKFTGDSYAQTGISVEGSLVANGTVSAPVVFTSLRDDSVGGDTNGDGEDSTPSSTDWSGVSVSSETAVVSLNRAEVRFAQYGVSGEGAASMSVTNSVVDGGILGSRAAGSKYADRAIAITGNTVRAGAIWVRSENTTSTAVPITVRGNTVTGHQPSWFENGMTEDFPIAVYDRRLQPSKLTGNTATGNTMNVLALSGTLIENWTVPTTGPRLVIPTSHTDVGLTIPAGKTMTAPAGTVIKFTAGSASRAAIRVEGALSANGTAAAPVVFTSLRDDTAGGDTNGDGADSRPYSSDWGGVFGADGGTVALAHAHIRWAETGVTVEAGSAALADVAITHADTCLSSWGGSTRFTGSVLDCPGGVVGGAEVDARDVEWGGGLGPRANGNPPAVGSLATYPWVGVPPAPPVPPAPAPQPVKVGAQCSEFVFIGARGSGQGASGLGGEVSKVSAAFTSQHPDTKVIAAAYSANSVPLTQDTWKVWTWINQVGDFMPSAWSGSVEILRQIRLAVDQCGDTGQRIILAGYSQGAWAVHAALAYLNASDSALLDRIGGVALIADPLRAPGSGIENAGSAAPGKGIASSRLGNPAVKYNDLIQTLALHDFPAVPNASLSDYTYPPSLTGVTVELCDDLDLVCDFDNLMEANGEIWLGIGVAGAMAAGAEVHTRYAEWALSDVGRSLARGVD